MSAPPAPFVLGVRTRRPPLVVGPAAAASLHLRVEIAELWDVVRVTAAPSASVGDVKRAALAEALPGSDPDGYVMKLRGIEVLDEGASLDDAGAIDGSIFLLMHRRRRPVR
jgi:hypothetical protein